MILVFEHRIKYIYLKIFFFKDNINYLLSIHLFLNSIKLII